MNHSSHQKVTAAMKRVTETKRIAGSAEAKEFPDVALTAIIEKCSFKMFQQRIELHRARAAKEAAE